MDNGRGVSFMWWWIVIILFVILILLIFLLIVTKITVNIFFQHEQDNDQLTIKFRALFGLVRYTVDVPLVKVDKDTGSVVVQEKTKMGDAQQKSKDKSFSPKEIWQSIEDTYQLVRHVVGLHEIIRRFMAKIEVKHLEWHTNIGVGDAAYTGMLVGTIWSVKGGVVGIIGNKMILRTTPNITVTPYFQQFTSQTLLKCMIRFRTGNAIMAGIRIVKYWKGGMPNFKTRPLSKLSKKEEQQTM